MGKDIYNTDLKIERLRARITSHPEILESNKEHILRFFRQDRAEPHTALD